MKLNDEVIYTIVVPHIDGAVARDNAHRVLSDQGVPVHLQRDEGHAISVSRLITRWRGDAAEQAWQEVIKAASPQAIIDVQPWSYAPGYPKGDIEP